MLLLQYYHLLTIQIITIGKRQIVCLCPIQYIQPGFFSRYFLVFSTVSKFFATYMYFYRHENDIICHNLRWFSLNYISFIKILQKIIKLLATMLLLQYYTLMLLLQYYTLTFQIITIGKREIVCPCPIQYIQPGFFFSRIFVFFNSF